ncbi:FAD dependent oxidoreductase [Lepidopterella palustris CBS 459.81]|uniref:FAD dependent oxidoreductase n=1 Tax=Lepidopterella palustris CBS 459.81 TaxID=1314670 RepID=A0A8E2E7I1_9PEZI|nr:FAD dependent oxidoreductase [Lepidopterella palustris CBS 459.81]
MDARARLPVPAPHPHPLPSYWHTPRSPLSSHRTSATLPETANTVIIGSGISGAMIAWNLLRQQAQNPSPPAGDIVMLEAREACGGATGRNGGHTKAASYRSYAEHKAQLGPEEALKIVRMEHANILATHAFADEQGIDCEAQQCDTVDIIYDKATFEKGRSAIEMLRADVRPEEREEGGVGAYRMFSVKEAVERFLVGAENANPTIPKTDKEEVCGAFLYPAGRINAYKLTTGVLSRCVELGMSLYTHTPVTLIRPIVHKSTSAPNTDARWELQIADSTVIQARTLILATNGYTAHIMPSLHTLIVPLKGQITAQRPGAESALPTPLPTTYSFIYKSGYEYMIPRPIPGSPTPTQHIIMGGGLARLPASGASEYGTVDDSTLNKSVSNYLRETAVGYFGPSNWGLSPLQPSKSMFGRLKETVLGSFSTAGGSKAKWERDESVVQEWTGIMGATADGLPFVGQVPEEEGLWVSAGFNGHGMVLCLKSAEALAHLVTGGKREDIEWFPKSFLITESRLQNCAGAFQGRTDMKV